MTMTASNNDDIIPNQVLDHHNISEEMNSVVSKLEPLLPITEEQRELLLLKFNWEIESLRNSFQEYADINSFLLENGVCPENTVSVQQKSECAICCSTKKVLGLRCQHMACLDCWSEYLTVKIRDGQCLLSCMEFGCGMLLSSKILGKFLCNSDLQMAHRKLIEEIYINSNPNLAWCNKKCGMAVRRLKNDTVTCSCGSTFCFLCESDAHFPATCRQIHHWKQQRMDSDQKTLSWILSNTRECPRCFVPIEKNGGCDHMTCYRCRHHFSWVYSQSYHNGFCYLSDIVVAKSRLRPRGNSHIFAQHFLRFERHEKYLKHRLDRRVLPANKRQNTLDKCRRVLMNSYVFSYYLKDGQYTSSLEIHQQNLEIAVEDLFFVKTGRRVFKLAEKCLTLRKALLAHCAEGAE